MKISRNKLQTAFPSRLIQNESHVHTGRKNLNTTIPGSPSSRNCLKDRLRAAAFTTSNVQVPLPQCSGSCSAFFLKVVRPFLLSTVCEFCGARTVLLKLLGPAAASCSAFFPQQVPMRMPVIFFCYSLPTPHSPPLLGVGPLKSDHQKKIMFMNDQTN